MWWLAAQGVFLTKSFFYKKYFPRRQSDIERVILKFQDDKNLSNAYKTTAGGFKKFEPADGGILRRLGCALCTFRKS